jgi:Protein of unknown function (DUF2442)
MSEKHPQNRWPEQSPRVVAVRPVDRYRLELSFEDGVIGIIDLDGWLIGSGGVMEALADREFFQRVSVNEEAGTIQWPNGVDLCPDVLYSRATGISIPFAEVDRSTAAGKAG